MFGTPACPFDLFHRNWSNQSVSTSCQLKTTILAVSGYFSLWVLVKYQNQNNGQILKPDLVYRLIRASFSNQSAIIFRKWCLLMKSGLGNDNRTSCYPLERLLEKCLYCKVQRSSQIICCFSPPVSTPACLYFGQPFSLIVSSFCIFSELGPRIHGKNFISSADILI